MAGTLSNKAVVITGASAGIGLVCALGAAREGAFLIITGRDPGRCASAQESILSQVPGARVRYAVADLAVQGEVHSLAETINTLLHAEGFNRLDILVNNAGTFCGKKTYTVDGIEKTFAVNHLAPFLLTHLLLPLLSAAPAGRVITVSSHSHTYAFNDPLHGSNPRLYFSLRAYGTSKLANVLFSAEFNRRNASSVVRAFAVDPGLVNTEMGFKETGRLAGWVWNRRRKLGSSPDLPAQTVLHLASEPTLQHSEDVYWKNSAPLQPSRKALDPDLASRLWEQSCSLCGIGEYFLE